MSGIMALVSRDGGRVPEEQARAQLAAIASRGDRPPRLWMGGGVALGHVHRATTPEAERESLPMVDAGGRYWLTWDGRIDNREQLARELAVEGVPTREMREMTDAAYVLAAFQRWGERCVEHLLGDWAIAIWDAEARRLFCAKDPLGWRPLFYTQSGGVFAAGSEPRQLFAGGLRDPAVNRDYLLRFLADAVPRPRATCYEGVDALEGGEALTVSARGVAVRRWWSGPAVRERRYRRPEEYVEEFAELSRRSVKARLRSSRPVAVNLSGGLDSSYVAAVAAEQGADIVAITAYAPGVPGADEREHARTVARHLGIEHVEIDIGDCWALSSRWLDDAAFDDPAAPPQAPHMIRLAQAARHLGRGVVLDGEGGDEWMDGDETCLVDAVLRGRPLTAWRLAKASRPAVPAARTLLRSLLAAAPPAVREAVAALRRERAAPGLLPFVEAEAGWVSRHQYQQRLTGHGARALGRQHAAHRLATRAINAWKDRHALQPNQLDARSPLHDLRVVELMAATPQWVKRFRGRRRDILREAGSRLLPRAVFDRGDKAYFDELARLGIASRERARLTDAARRVAAYPGVRGDEVEREVGIARAHNKLTWRTGFLVASAGLFMRHVDIVSACQDGTSRQDGDAVVCVDHGQMGDGREEAVREAATAVAR